MEDSHYLISSLTTKLQETRGSGISLMIDTQASETEKSTEIDPYLHGQLIFHKSAKVIQCGKEEFLYNRWCCNSWLHTHMHTSIFNPCPIEKSMQKTQ